VRSVLEQRDPDWRLTVVDDGYPDGSVPGWFAGLGDDRVRYHRNETNLGAHLSVAAGARSVGCDQAAHVFGEVINHASNGRRPPAHAQPHYRPA